MSKPMCTTCDKPIRGIVYTDKGDNPYCKKCAPTFNAEYTDWITTCKTRAWEQLRRATI